MALSTVCSRLAKSDDVKGLLSQPSYWQERLLGKHKNLSLSHMCSYCPLTGDATKINPMTACPRSILVRRVHVRVLPGHLVCMHNGLVSPCLAETGEVGVFHL